ncbi:MAG: putative membrane protein [Flavobacteriales bacterium]|jgi:putative membrane protein|tara:strand:- start:539 stop:1549 length:1011 start_codon:yes stop_codon:yes gene_type:complete
MPKNRSFLDNLFLFFKGLSMGAANKVPGVSGGTVAFVLDFYEELIYSFQKINLKALKLLINGRFKSFFRYINAQFLTLVMLGSMFSFFSVSRVLDFFIRHYELYVWSAFFGMILGSIYYIGKDFKWTKKSRIATVIGIIIGILISLMNPAKENDNLWFVFFCGMVGVSGMTLPGLSGSFILILLGNYVLLLVDSVNVLYKTFTDVLSGNWSFLEDTVRIRYLKIVAIFTGGSAFGLVFTSHILGYVLKRWNQIVTAVIIGFITGSLGIIWPWKKEIYKLENGITLKDFNGDKVIENYQRYFPNFANSETLFAILFILLGFALLLLLDLYSKRTNKT